ncbi:uncharacterized protein LOC144296597 [Canis aureus]
MGYGQKARVQGEGGFSGAELPEEVAHPYPSGSVTEVEPRGSSWRPPCFTFAPAVARWPRPSPLKPKGTSPAAVEAVRCGTWAGRPAGTVWRSWGAAGGRALRSALHGAARTAPGGRGPAARTHLRPLRPTAPAGVRGRGPSCHGLGRPRSGIRGQSTCGPGGSCRARVSPPHTDQGAPPDGERIDLKVRNGQGEAQLHNPLQLVTEFSLEKHQLDLQKIHDKGFTVSHSDLLLCRR